MLLEQRDFVLNLLHCLGLLVNCKELIPIQEVYYFEAHFILNEGVVFPLEERFQNRMQDYTITQVSHTGGFNDSVHRFNSIGPFYICCLSNYISSLCRIRTGTIC